MTFKKISKFVILSIFCASFIHIPNVCASQNSDDEMGPPSPKRSKTVEEEGDNIHTYDRSIPKPNPLISSTTNLPEIDITTQFASSSAPLPPVTASTPVIASTSKRTLITDFFKAGPSVPVLTGKKIIIPETEELKDSFRIFNVGQGNSQLAIYAEGPGEIFAILYDCGTSAETVSSKVLKIQSSNKESQPFLVRKAELVESSKPIAPTLLPATSSDEKSSSEQTAERKSTEGSLESSDNSFSNDADTESPRKPIIEDIKNTLRNIENLFVVLSHPDKDHINLIKDSLSTTANVLFILCGNFFVENDKADLKKNINELFSFISTRMRLYPAKTHFTFPYFWPSEHKTPYSTLNYQEIKSFLLTYLPASKRPLGIDTHLPKGFQGNFSTFLQRMQQIDFQGSVDNTSQVPFYVKFLNDDRLQNIYIWYMNQISDNINNHSPVISFRMPNLEKTFICTGDAGPEVFLKIQKKVSKQTAIQQAKESSSVAPMLEDQSITMPTEPMRLAVDAQLYGETPQPYIVMLMLPHHGAEKNLSYSMLDLFAPHILGISAGAGSMYRHPSTDLIKRYKKAYKEKAYLQNRRKELWEHYETDVAHFYLTFKDETKTSESKKSVVRARLTLLQNNSLPVLSTGISGTIHIAKDEFYGQFIDHFEYNDQIYSIDFSQSICENDKESPKVTGELLEIKAETKKVHITSNIEKINYAGTTFIKSKPKKWSPKKVFLSVDGEQLLVSLDIKQKGSNSKTVQKFYLGHKVITDN